MAGRWDAAARGALLSRLALGETRAAATAAIGLTPRGLLRKTAADAAFRARVAEAEASGVAARNAAKVEAKAAAAAASKGTRIVAGRRSTGALKRIAMSRIRLTPEREECFFATLAATANVRKAARSAKVATATLYARRARDAAFRLRWAATIDEAMVDLQLAMIERTRAGLTTAAIRRGGVETALSERFAIALIAKHRPARTGPAAEPGADAAYADRRATATAARERLTALLDSAETGGGNG